jgi:hypothetical protein
MIDYAELLGGCIGSANNELKRLGNEPHSCLPTRDDGRVTFLESQLAHIVKDLTGMLVDLASGKTISDLGFDSEDEFTEMIEMCALQIQTLKARIRSLREVGR